MPHPAYGSESTLYADSYFYYGGVLVATGQDVRTFGLVQYPASRSNPKILGYRAPANWYAQNWRMNTSDGDYSIVRDSDGLVLRASGQISGFGKGEIDSILKLDPSLVDNVLRKVLSEMVEDDVAFNAFLIQGKQSLKMVADLATGLAHGTNKLMTADYGQPKKFRKFLANASKSAIDNFSGKYLEYLYGWKPLADDVENAFQSMIDGYTGPEAKRFRLKVRKSQKRKQVVEITRPASVYFTSNSYWTQELTQINRAKVVLHYEFPSQAGEMLPTMTPFGTLWELAPWSFVADWFIPIGDYIGAMEATQYAIYMRDAVLTQSVQVAGQPGSRSRWSTTYAPPGWTSRPGQPPTVSGKAFQMTREVLTPVQVLDRIRFPSFSSKFGLPQASQALALLSQVLKKWF